MYTKGDTFFTMLYINCTPWVKAIHTYVWPCLQCNKTFVDAKGQVSIAIEKGTALNILLNKIKSILL